MADLKTDLAVANAAQQHELQQEISVLKQINEEAAERAKRAEAAQLDCWQQSQEMQSQVRLCGMETPRRCQCVHSARYKHQCAVSRALYYIRPNQWGMFRDMQTIPIPSARQFVGGNVCFSLLYSVSKHAASHPAADLCLALRRQLVR